MPKSNHDVAREGLEAWSRKDLESALEGLHPEIEWHLIFPLPDLANKMVYKGRDEVRVAWSAFHDGFETLTAEIEKVIWERPDALVMRTRVRGVGKGSGLEVEPTVFFVMKVRDEMVILWKGFFEQDEAIEFAEGLDGD
jgi:ketosteroid isomerase-like protein